MTPGPDARILRESAMVFCANLFARTSGVFASLPAPSDSRAITVEGRAAYRILLMGAGIVTGAGVSSHLLGVGGHVARHVAAETTHGVALDVLPVSNLLLRFVSARLSRLDLGDYDAVILAVGVNDAFGVTSPKAWRRRLESTLLTLRARLPQRGRVFLLAIADPRQTPIFRAAPSRRAWRRAQVLNTVSAHVVADDLDSVMIDFEIGVPGDDNRLYGAATYLRWARQLAPRLIAGLERNRSES